MVPALYEGDKLGTADSEGIEEGMVLGNSVGLDDFDGIVDGICDKDGLSLGCLD